MCYNNCYIIKHYIMLLHYEYDLMIICIYIVLRTTKFIICNKHISGLTGLSFVLITHEHCSYMKKLQIIYDFI